MSKFLIYIYQIGWIIMSLESVISSSSPCCIRVSQLVYSIKQLLEQSSCKDYQKTIRNIENEIDGKQNQIRQLFARNIDSVTRHYIRYFQVSSHQRRLQTMCDQFEKKIQKNHKLSQYDEQKIDNSQKMLSKMANTKEYIGKYRDYIRLIKKITINLNEEKYNNAIKLYHKAKCMILDKLEKTPLMKCLPIIKSKIEEHLQKLMDIFWEENSVRQLQLGKGCFTKILLNQKQKVNIHQMFFGTTISTRISSITRNSLFRNSSLRQTIINKNQSTLSFLKSMNQDKNDSLNRFILRANVQMSQLRQVKFLCQQLQSDMKVGGSNFSRLVCDNIFKNLRNIHQNSPCEGEEDYKRIVCHMVGFLLIIRQVTSMFNIIQLDRNLFVGEIYAILRKQVKAIVRVGLRKFMGVNNLVQDDFSQCVLHIKQYSEMFFIILGLLKIQTNPRGYALLVEEILKSYCEVALERYEGMIQYEMRNDNLMGYKAESEEEEESINEILGLNESGFADNRNRDKRSHSTTTTGPSPQEYNFTGFVVFMITIYQNLYQTMLNLVQHSTCNKSLLHQNFSQILQRVLSLYGSQLITKDHPLQICQGQINIMYIEHIYKYYSGRLQIEYNYSKTVQSCYGQKLAQLVIELRRRMRELVEQKVELMLSSYYSQQHKVKRQQHVEYVQWLMDYVLETVNYMKRLHSTFVEQLLYSIITYIQFFYWQYLKQLSQFSLITIHNLNLDLNFIYKFIAQHLSTYPSLADKLLSLQQFYSLMLSNNINDIVDPQKRIVGYSKIDVNLLVSILLKYNRVNCHGLRDLKKRELEPIIKRLQAQIL